MDEKNYYRLGERIMVTTAEKKIISRVIFFVKECIEEYTDEDVTGLLIHIGYKAEIVEPIDTTF